MIELNLKEQRLNDIMVKFIGHEIKIEQVKKLTGLSERQIYRKKRAYLEKGVESIPHGLKKKPSKKGYSQELRDTIIKLYRKEYNGWNFHHFNDAIEDDYGIKVSDSFIYRLLTKEGIESPQKHKKKGKPHPPRERRENAGELIQVDASKHKWLYNNENYYHLHGGIDDSTGQVTSCFLAKEETIWGYQMILKDTIQDFGIPECLYTDYRTVFQSSKKELTLEEELNDKQIKNTRFANMAQRLGIDIKSTLDPRSKGRIERLWRTFQDRLQKKLYKKKISTIKEANEYIKNVFLPRYNARFASSIDYNRNVFVKVDEKFDYNKELAIFSEHKIYHNCYLKYNKQYYVIMKNNEKVSLYTDKKVVVYKFLDGTEHILFKDEWYDLVPVKNIDIQNKDGKKSTKTIEEINKSKVHKPSDKHPWVAPRRKRLVNLIKN